MVTYTPVEADAGAIGGDDAWRLEGSLDPGFEALRVISGKAEDGSLLVLCLTRPELERPPGRIIRLAPLEEMIEQVGEDALPLLVAGGLGLGVAPPTLEVTNGGWAAAR